MGREESTTRTMPFFSMEEIAKLLDKRSLYWKFIFPLLFFSTCKPSGSVMSA